MTRSRLALRSVALVITSLCMGTAWSAPDGGNLTPSKVQPQVFTGALKLQKTYVDVGTAGGQAIPLGVFTSYGNSVSVSCGVAAGCYIQISAEAQFAPTDTEGLTSLCLKVNGTNTDGCPVLNRSSTISFTSFSHTGGMAVPQGTHVVSTAVYSSVGAKLYNFNTTVRLFKS